MKSWLDGQHIEAIVTGKTNVYWPNGITVDIQTEKIYWVDANRDRLVSATVNGTDIKVLVSGMYRIPHPYGISIFKVSSVSSLLLRLLYIHVVSVLCIVFRALDNFSTKEYVTSSVLGQGVFDSPSLTLVIF
jgi:hypothetical protein